MSPCYGFLIPFCLSFFILFLVVQQQAPQGLVRIVGQGGRGGRGGDATNGGIGGRGGDGGGIYIIDHRNHFIKRMSHIWEEILNFYGWTSEDATNTPHIVMEAGQPGKDGIETNGGQGGKGGSGGTVRLVSTREEDEGERESL